MNRRDFLRLAIVAPLGVLVHACERAGTGLRRVPDGLLCLSEGEWRTLDAVAATFWPAEAGRPAGDVAGVALACDRLLARAHPGLLRELKQALWLWEFGPFLFGYGERFSRLTPEARIMFSALWRSYAVYWGVMRRVYVALMRLSAMVYHMQALTWSSMGYDGPWVGRVDVGLGLSNQGVLTANPNGNVFDRWDFSKPGVV